MGGTVNNKNYKTIALWDRPTQEAYQLLERRPFFWLWDGLAPPSPPGTCCFSSVRLHFPFHTSHSPLPPLTKSQELPVANNGSYIGLTFHCSTLLKVLAFGLLLIVSFKDESVFPKVPALVLFLPWYPCFINFIHSKVSAICCQHLPLTTLG